MDGEHLATYIYMISKEFSASSGLIPTTTSQFNKHARVQRKYCNSWKCKLMNECQLLHRFFKNKCEMILN